jgi:hypothetical protein
VLVTRPLPHAARIHPVLVSAALASLTALAHLAVRPRTPDFAAQVYRSELFGRLQFTAWDGAWYSGHHIPGYSVLFPPLGWALSPELVAALASVVAASAFGWLVEAGFGARARPGSWWFATLGTASELFAGRLTFVLGLACALLAAVALAAGRTAAGAGLAAVTGLASPVAALFLALAGAAEALARAAGHAVRRSLPALAIAAAAVVPVLMLAVLFPEGGREPFYKPFFITTLGMTVAAGLLLPRRSPPALVAGVVLCALGTLVAYEASTPVGSNVARLGTLVAGPLLACALLSARSVPRARAALAAGVSAYALWHFPPWFERGALMGSAVMLAGMLRRPSSRLWTVGVIAGLLPFAIFQWSQSWVDLKRASSDPAAHAGYFAPLFRFLESTDRPVVWRVEIPPMRDHWESVYVAPRYPLARGWERQLDTRDAALFYRPHARRHYRVWLEANAVRFVAFPDAPLDFAAGREAAILRHPPRYLRLRGRLRHWRIYQVTPAPRLVVPEGRARIAARALGPRSVELTARTPGNALVRVRYTRYWRLRGGCVSRSGAFTRITTARTGRLRLVISVTPGRLFGGDGRRCG